MGVGGGGNGLGLLWVECFCFREDTRRKERGRKKERGEKKKEQAGRRRITSDWRPPLGYPLSTFFFLAYKLSMD